jgi:hypothetical protein
MLDEIFRIAESGLGGTEWLMLQEAASGERGDA